VFKTINFRPGPAMFPDCAFMPTVLKAREQGTVGTADEFGAGSAAHPPDACSRSSIPPESQY
jgi:hypothetical protein